ncbi:hypothetical protein AGMMS50276_01560 [Synergistales bacterium]|nr:hypothetical protein AGMMS50276_01560 [Synergistales bacterium]
MGTGAGVRAVIGAVIGLVCVVGLYGIAKTVSAFAGREAGAGLSGKFSGGAATKGEGIGKATTG